jgi:hypothetical protein
MVDASTTRGHREQLPLSERLDCLVSGCRICFARLLAREAFDAPSWYVVPRERTCDGCGEVSRGDGHPPHVVVWLGGEEPKVACVTCRERVASERRIPCWRCGGLPEGVGECHHASVIVQGNERTLLAACSTLHLTELIVTLSVQRTGYCPTCAISYGPATSLKLVTRSVVPVATSWLSARSWLVWIGAAGRLDTSSGETSVVDC